MHIFKGMLVCRGLHAYNLRLAVAQTLMSLSRFPRRFRTAAKVGRSNAYVFQFSAAMR